MAGISKRQIQSLNSILSTFILLRVHQWVTGYSDAAYDYPYITPMIFMLFSHGVFSYVLMVDFTNKFHGNFADTEAVIQLPSVS